MRQAQDIDWLCPEESCLPGRPSPHVQRLQSTSVWFAGTGQKTYRLGEDGGRPHVLTTDALDDLWGNASWTGHEAPFQD